MAFNPITTKPQPNANWRSFIHTEKRKINWIPKCVKHENRRIFENPTPYSHR
jgi:hypothetical protein